jgi:hypothetical protein
MFRIFVDRFERHGFINEGTRFTRARHVVSPAGMRNARNGEHGSGEIDLELLLWQKSALPPDLPPPLSPRPLFASTEPVQTAPEGGYQ